MDVLIGLGEIGLPLWKLLNHCGRKTYGYDIDDTKTYHTNIFSSIKTPNKPEKADILHICIPYKDQKEFINTVADYGEEYEPEAVLIHSTVGPGTTKAIYSRLTWVTLHEEIEVAHSPVNGKHKTMYEDLKRYPKYVGFANDDLPDDFFDKSLIMGCLLDVFPGGVVRLPDSTHTEWAKLLSTTFFGWQIAFHQEIERLADEHNLHFDSMKSIIDIAEYMPDTDSIPDYSPPFYSGVIGGHCVIQNTEILSRFERNEYWDLILQSNDWKIKREKKS